jgi:hypothetical protein
VDQERGVGLSNGSIIPPFTGIDMIVIGVRDEMETDFGNSGDNNRCTSMRKGSRGNKDLRDG